MMSLRQRLNRGLTLILCAVFFIHWLAADAVIRTVAEKQMATRLSHDSDSLLDTLTLDANHRVRFDSFHVGSIYGQAFSGHYFVMQIDADCYYSVSLQNQLLNVEPADAGKSAIYHLDGGPKQQPLLVLSRNLKKFGHTINLSVAEDLTDIHHDIAAIRLAYLGLSIVILLCSIALQSSDVKQALRPLKEIRQQMTAVAGGQLQQLTDTLAPAEIKPLVTEVNRLLLLAVRRLQQSRTAVGNLAHALKTPLAVLVRAAENPLLSGHPELRQQLLTQTASIHRHLERELKRARIAGNQQAATVFNPHQELTALIQLLQNIYSEKQLQIELKATDAPVHFDREDLLELAGNLLDNACKWAKQRINVEISFAEQLLINVADDGPGCDAADLESLSNRGLRLDESVTGHGLGLAIIRDIVGYYDGLLMLSHSQQLGGFLATVKLPLNHK